MKTSARPGAISRRDVIRLLVAAAGATGAVMPRAQAAHPEKGSVNMAHDLAKQDLSKLTAEHFEPLVGETFSVGSYRLTLRSVRRGLKTGSRFREQFAITFKAPRGRELPIRSELLAVAHPAIGRHDLLVTQVLDGADGTALEVCFS
jgi:Domain of unknown function (DUF6916)